MPDEVLPPKVDTELCKNYLLALAAVANLNPSPVKARALEILSEIGEKMIYPPVVVR